MTTPNGNEIFLLDTNILFDLSVWLPITLNKSFWDKFEGALKNGIWVLLDVVVNEIKYDNDGLKNWCQNQQKKGLVNGINNDHRNRATEINKKYPLIDQASSRSTVDTYLLAYAESNKLTVFSREAYRKNLTELFKIPDVCKELKIPLLRIPKRFFESIGYKN